ncbi:MAG TPA: tetratricopeptide repeat protein, partial [Burkholderiales bacterium]|nr:tetratricopeptide repeat protein [Burkholderiales bacterium]
MNRPGRNDPCPCGSGKKYKHCCLFKEGGALPGVPAARPASAAAGHALPAAAVGHFRQGMTFGSQGRFQAAAESLRRALAVHADFPEAHCNLGNALVELGQPADAESSFRRALALRPAFAAAHYNLANLLARLGQADEAIAHYREAIAAQPAHAEAHANLGNLLLARGQPGQALGCFAGALRLSENDTTKRAFAHGIRGMEFLQPSPEMKPLVARAIAEAWGAPGDLAQAGKSLLMQVPAIRACVERAMQAWPSLLPSEALYGSEGIAAVATEPLLLALLQSTIVPGLELERFLVMARALLLDTALSGTDSTAWLEFHCALARQCFINEYVYAVSAEEARKVDELRHRLLAALQADASIPALQLAAAAAYFALGDLQDIERVPEAGLPSPIRALLNQQVLEPRVERDLQAALRRLTAI